MKKNIMYLALLLVSGVVFSACLPGQNKEAAVEETGAVMVKDDDSQTMLKEDAITYGKDIVKYFLVKNSNLVPLHYRTKVSLDAYFEMLTLSNVDDDYIEETKQNYYTKYNLKK